jgi:hypothetical protein
MNIIVITFFFLFTTFIFWMKREEYIGITMECFIYFYFFVVLYMWPSFWVDEVLQKFHVDMQIDWEFYLIGIF